MVSIPMLQIIFYLAIMFSPTGTKSIAITAGWNQQITWTLQKDGTWKAANATGDDMGAWSVNGAKVLIARDGDTAPTDLTGFVKEIAGPDWTRTATVEGKPLTISKTEDGRVTFSQEAGGLFEKAVTITTGK